MRNSPCYKCGFHSSGCHCGCQAYLDWQKKHLEEKEASDRARREFDRGFTHERRVRRALLYYIMRGRSS